ncbi:MAG: molybdopterin-guanine dinucleotide biosynthesis protein B [Gammaproteobacteria bacterium]|nr:molybdopterin-guanine dinucleotide biosynthesis protein B [Gammaproteobacteria bacterium]
MQKVFGIAGFKNSGKTTLVVELLRFFVSQGLRVATLKHAHHEFDVDHPGKDSYQHREAGAAEVMVVSAKRWAHLREFNATEEPTFDEALAQLGEVDLVLVEGWKNGYHPRLELRRSDVKARSLAQDDPGIKAIVSDIPLPEAKVPVLLRDDIDSVAAFILRELDIN